MAHLFRSVSPALPWLFVLIWSTGFVVAGGVTGRIDPHLFLFVRFSLVAVIFFAIGTALKIDWPDRATVARLLVLGLFLQGLYLGPGYWVVANGMPVALIVLLATLQPPLTAMISGRMFGEPITRNLILGLALGICGVGLAVQPSLAATGFDGVRPLVLFVSCLSIIAFTVGTLLQKNAAMAKVHLVASSAWQHVSAAICTGFFVLLLDENLFIEEFESLFSLGWAVIVLSLGGTTLLVWMVRGGQATRVTSLMFLVAPLAALEAFVLFGEALAPIQIVGFVVALTGVLLARRA